MNSHDLPIYDELIDPIEDGRKPLDVRVGTNKVKRIKVGDRIRFHNRKTRRMVSVIVTARHTYESFDEMLDNVHYDLIVPGTSRGYVYQELTRVYPFHMEQLGVYVFEFRKE